jgi:putative transposase
MNTVRIYQLKSVSATQFRRLRDAQMEAAQVWNCCMQAHRAARLQHMPWPGRDALQKATKGRFALHSQSVQMVVHAFLANIDTTHQLRQTHPQMRMRYPYKVKRFYPVSWPAQSVSREQGRVVLPMGRGRTSLILPLDLPETSTSVMLVWNNEWL